LKNRIPVGTWRGPIKGLTTNRQYEYALAYSEGPAIPTDYRERCPDPVAGRAVGEEDYSHSNYITGATPRKTHIQKEIGYLDRKKSVSARDEAKGEGR